MKRLQGIVIALFAVLWCGTAQAAAPLPCAAAPAGVCGSIDVPLDRANPALGSISIGYELYPHTDGSIPAAGTLLPNPGGPGESTTSGRDAWRSRFGPVLDRYDLLLIDDRGRGSSGAIDCPDLQHGIGDLFSSIAACSAQLGATAGDYGSAAIADDVDAVRASLGIDKLTYYGESYGGVDIEAYATRHGDHLAAVVADAPWTSLADPLQQSEVPALIRLVVLSCTRAPGCAARNPDPAGTLTWLARRIQRAPLTGTGTTFDGRQIPVRLDESLLINLLIDNGSGSFGSPGELTAAARAWHRGDAAPILRLAAEQLDGFSFPGDSGDPTDFSLGSYLATWCTDSLELYDTAAPQDVRAAQYAAALRALPEHVFGPFSVPGYAAFLRLFEGGDICVPWSSPRQDVVAPGATYPDVPVLVLSGDMDAVVPTEYVDAYAARWPQHTLVHVAGSAHVTLSHSPCARTIILHFLATLDAGDTSCASAPIPAFATADYPLTVRDAVPAAANAGDGSTTTGRRAATVAALTVLDALKRAAMGGTPLTNPGLRGGTFHVSEKPDGRRVARLDADRYALDEAVTGSAEWTADRQLDATVDVDGAASGHLRLQGPLLVTVGDVLHVTGQLDGRPIDVTVPST